MAINSRYSPECSVLERLVAFWLIYIKINELSELGAKPKGGSVLLPAELDEMIIPHEAPAN